MPGTSGGSERAMAVTAQYRGVTLTFDRMPTPAELRRAYEQRRGAIGRCEDPHPPLSPGQEQLWFLERLDPGTSVYAIPLCYRLEGRIDLEAMALALSGLVRRHAALRTTFPAHEGRPYQRVHPAG